MEQEHETVLKKSKDWYDGKDNIAVPQVDGDADFDQHIINGSLYVRGPIGGSLYARGAKIGESLDAKDAKIGELLDARGAKIGESLYAGGAKIKKSLDAEGAEIGILSFDKETKIGEDLNLKGAIVKEYEGPLPEANRYLIDEKTQIPDNLRELLEGSKKLVGSSKAK